MSNDQHIKKPSLDWGASGTTPVAPRSIFFDDIYFSGDGPTETTHVFLNGNHLPARFEKASRFTIGELGFGTGLNFLVAWDAWRTAPKPEGATLNFLSTEQFPLSTEEMAKAHTAWPALGALSQKLRDALPPQQPGIHQIDIEERVTLTLLYGDALTLLSKSEATIDAWFLDGFSPAKNPAMWSPELMKEVARLSVKEASAATFTVAGPVRRALGDAGFAVEKTPGYGRKREMLQARLSQPKTTRIRAPWFDTTAKPLSRNAKIAIIGAGIAGASLADALKHEGFAPTVFDAQGPASGASGNPAGLIMPRLDLGNTPEAAFFKAAYIYTLSLFRKLNAREIFNPCGIHLHALSDREKERQQKLYDSTALPDDWIEHSPDGLFFPQAGIVSPGHFVRHLLTGTQLITEIVSRLTRKDDAWRIETDKNAHSFDAVIIANGLEGLRFSQLRGLPLAGSAGQLDWFPEAPAPESAHAFGPYAAPAPQGGLVIGATYAPIAIGAEARFSPEATQSNLDAVAKVMPNAVRDLSPAESTPRVAVRCTTPDRLPIAGPVPDWGFYSGAYDGLRGGKREDYPPGETLTGLYVLTGLGSRGLVTAPLLAAAICAELAGTPSPLPVEVAQAIHPARFFIRDLKRSKS